MNTSESDGGQYFSWLMNEENPRMETEDRAPNQGMTSPVSEAETERALSGMRCGKAVGSDEIPVEVWKCLGQLGLVTLCKLFNRIMTTECIPSAWRNSIVVPIFKEKGDVQECKNDRGIKLLTQTFKIWEKVVDRRLIECTEIHESQFGFMPGRSTTDAIFILTKADNRKTPGRPEGHKSHLHRYRESLRSGTEGGDLEMHEGAQCTRKIC